MLCCGPYVVLLKGPCGALALYMEEPLEEVPLVITVQFVPLRLSGIVDRWDYTSLVFVPLYSPTSTFNTNTEKPHLHLDTKVGIDYKNAFADLVNTNIKGL